MSEEIVQEDNYEEVDVDEVEESVEETDTEETDPNDPYANLSDEELRSRLKKAESALVKNKKKTKQITKSTKAPESEDEIPEWGRRILETELKRQFQSDNKLSADTVDAVFRANGGKMPTAEQMESDELIKSVIRSFESKARVAANTPSGGSTPTYKGKTYAEIVTDKESTQADKQAAFEVARKKHNIT